MIGASARAARFAVRPLLPGPEEALREELLSLAAGPASLGLLARSGSVEALALRGLAPDEARILEREVSALGGTLVVDPLARRGLILASLHAVGELPGRLRAFSRRVEPLADAIQSAMAGKGTRPPLWDCCGVVLPTGRRTILMGIVNLTPDSFSGDGLAAAPEAAVERGLAMVEAGADVLDLGGASTRPHAAPVAPEEEVRRLLPVLEELARRSQVPLSVDTRHARVAERAIAAGARIVNDVWGLRADPRMAAVCAAAQVGVVVMDNRRAPVGGSTGALLDAVVATLGESLGIADSAGISAERVVVDPGLGFGKTPAQNLAVIRRLGELRGLGRPILVGASRKSTIGLVLADAEGRAAPVEERVEGTLALHSLAIAAGADIVRVHDVAAARRAARVVDAVVRGAPAELAEAPAPGPTG